MKQGPPPPSPPRRGRPGRRGEALGARRSPEHARARLLSVSLSGPRTHPPILISFPIPVSILSHSSVVDLVGGTPLVRLRKVVPRSKDTAKIFAKLESMQPNSSVKDR